MVNRLIVLFLILLCFASLTSSLNAGDWHTASQLICSDCHTMHGSQAHTYTGGGVSISWTPSPNLLKYGTTTALCLSCHDGTDANAPDVVTPVAYVSDPAGGFFARAIGLATDFGHKLGIALTPPGSADPAMTLTCASCHNVHGSSSYRNLLLNPPGSGNTADVTVVVNQTVSANGTNRAQVYIPSNLKYKSGMSQWCNDCHTNFHGRTASEEGTASPWFRHPQEKQISGSTNVDYTYWSGTITNRVPVQTPTDDTIPSTDDQAFCLSCHKAHGSANRAGTIFADGTTLMSTCQQCHNQ